MPDYSLNIDLNTDNRSVDITVREKVEGEFNPLDTQSFGIDGIHEDLKLSVELYGLSKLLQDRSSGTPKGPDKLAAMNEVFAQLVSGQWTKERARGAAVVSAEVEALAELKGCDIATIQRSLKNYSKEQKELIFAKDAVKAKAAEIRARRENTDTIQLDDLVA